MCSRCNRSCNCIDADNQISCTEQYDSMTSHASLSCSVAMGHGSSISLQCINFNTAILLDGASIILQGNRKLAVHPGKEVHIERLRVLRVAAEVTRSSACASSPLPSQAVCNLCPKESVAGGQHSRLNVAGHGHCFTDHPHRTNDSSNLAYGLICSCLARDPSPAVGSGRLSTWGPSDPEACTASIYIIMAQ